MFLEFENLYNYQLFDFLNILLSFQKFRIWKEITIILYKTIIANTFYKKTIFEFKTIFLVNSSRLFDNLLNLSNNIISLFKQWFI